MHATVHPRGRSPKPINVPQLKPGSDNIQNSAASYSSQIKGKKRERGDQGSESVKREHSSKTDDADSGQLKSESILKYEIAKITDKGGLADSEGVEKLVQLMQLDRVERKMDLSSQSMLAGVIATTENFDCLMRFVQLRGVAVLDEWLQDIHKGKIGDIGAHRDGDKFVEDFLLVLLRALDKLPVNLHTLQMCNIGRSVNHLRTHKNFEIQKKARSLVDTWKKRVEAEMNIIDAKSGSTQAVSWPSKSRSSDVSHGGNRHCASSEVAMKSSITQISASKPSPVKPVQGETAAKSASSSPGQIKSALSPASLGDGQLRISAGSSSDVPLTTPREEKSSSSSQSHNCSQSFSGKEDARSSTAGSMNVNKISNGTSRHRKLSNGFPASAVSGGHRKSGSSRNLSLQRNPAEEKISKPDKKALDVPIVEGNSYKLIVKIPNWGRSPAQSASGRSFEDRSIMDSRASSPVLGEKNDQFDHNLKEKNDAYQANIMSDVNTESWQSNDFKDVLTGSDEGDGSPAAIPDEERSRSAEDTRKSAEVSKAASSSSGIKPKSGKLQDTSVSSMNALIESCDKYSEANPSMSLRDDGGMSLLASVATGEMSKSDLVSPTDSLQMKTPIGEDTCMVDDAKSKSSDRDNFAPTVSQLIDTAIGGTGKGGALWNKNGIHSSKHASVNFSMVRKTTPSPSEEIPAGERNDQFVTSTIDLQPTPDTCMAASEKSDVLISDASVSLIPDSTAANVMDVEIRKQLHEEQTAVISTSADGIPDTKPKERSSWLMENNVSDGLSSVEDEKQAVEMGENKSDLNEGFNGVHAERQPPAVMLDSECKERTDDEFMCPDSNKDLISVNINQLKVEKPDKMDDRINVNTAERQRIDQETNNPPVLENQAGRVSTAIDQKSDAMVDANVDSKEVHEHLSGAAVLFKESPAQGTKHHVKLRGAELTDTEVDKAEECELTTAEASFSVAGAPDMYSKLKFDLNEGFVVEDGKYGDPINLITHGSSSVLHLINPLRFPISSVSSSLPASITVAAAAKGPFFPPEDLLRSKGGIGWKGSASTSAFRPAEPRKILEMPLQTANSPLPDASASKHGRPLLDIDLNMPGEGVLEDMNSLDFAPETGSTSKLIDLTKNELMDAVSIRSSGGLGFDLNQVDEANDMGQYSSSSFHRRETLLPPVKLSSLGGFPSAEVKRDFDLNNGPAFDDLSAETSSFNQRGWGSVQPQPPVACLRMNHQEIRNFSTWFPSGNFSGITIPPVLPDRGELPFPIVAPGAPQRLLGPPTGGATFNPDVFCASVLSSSPARPFPSMPFQYPVFPVGTTFPLPSTNFSVGSNPYIDSSSAGRLGFPAVHSQLIGPVGAVLSNCPRPYLVSLPDGSNNVGVENNRKWGRQGLDLNAGPSGLDIEGRDNTLPLASTQLPVASSQTLAAEEARMYQVPSGVLKRKGPEEGWDTENFKYKQASRQ